MPSMVGRYRIERVLGSGAFASVWLAHDDVLEAQVAVKVLAGALLDDLDVRNRFLDEARILRRVDSERLVRVHDIGELDDGRPYFVMSYADRGTLAERMRNRLLPAGEALRLAAEVARGVDVINRLGIIHRDLKPSNVLFQSTTDGGERLLIADLGLAKALAQASGAFTLPVGTPGYMSPEQARFGGGLDVRADVYGLGALAYHLLTGRAPGSAPVTVRPSDLRPGLPPAVDEIVMRALETDRELRWPTAAAFATALRLPLTSAHRSDERLRDETSRDGTSRDARIATGLDTGVSSVRGSDTVTPRDAPSAYGASGRDDLTRQDAHDDATRLDDRDDATRLDAFDDATRRDPLDDSTRRDSFDDLTRPDSRDDPTRRDSRRGPARWDGRVENATALDPGARAAGPADRTMYVPPPPIGMAGPDDATDRQQHRPDIAYVQVRSGAGEPRDHTEPQPPDEGTGQERRTPGRLVLAILGLVVVLAAGGGGAYAIARFTGAHAHKGKAARDDGLVTVSDASGRLSLRVPPPWKPQPAHTTWPDAVPVADRNTAPALRATPDYEQFVRDDVATPGVFVGLTGDLNITLPPTTLGDHRPRCTPGAIRGYQRGSLTGQITPWTCGKITIAEVGLRDTVRKFALWVRIKQVGPPDLTNRILDSIRTKG